MNTLQAISKAYHPSRPPRQNEIARDLGVSRQRYNNWALGKYEPDTRSLRKMLRGSVVQRAFASAILDIHAQAENAQMLQDGLGTSVLVSHDETGVGSTQPSGQAGSIGNPANLPSTPAAILAQIETGNE